MPIDQTKKFAIWAKEIENANVVSTMNRQVLTVMPCVSTAGKYIAPLIIFEGKAIIKAIINLIANENAYMNKEFFRTWYLKFIEHVKPRKNHHV